MIRIPLACVVTLGLVIMCFSGNWNGTASQASLATDGSVLRVVSAKPFNTSSLPASANETTLGQPDPVVVPNGIRLATPLEVCSMQPGCANLCVSVFVPEPRCQIPAVFTVIVTGGRAPYSFSAIDPDGNAVSLSPPQAGGGGTVVTFVATKTGSYTVTVTDANGCRVMSEGSFVPCCALTQSEWGKKKPKFNGEKRPKTVGAQLKTPGLGPLIVGIPGSRSLTFMNESAASCVIFLLPTAGTSASLPSQLGDRTINPDSCQTDPPLTDNVFQGLLQNQLLGETIALSFNERFDTDIRSVVLCNSMVTRGVIAAPNSGTELGVPGNLLDPSAMNQAVMIPPSILNAIAAGSSLESTGKFTSEEKPNTVARLLKLANLALGGETSLGGASLTDINNAVDATNRAFDGCRFLLSCTNPSPGDTDECSGATVAGGVPYTNTQDVSIASRSASDPVPCAGGGSHSVWYRFTPASSGTITVDTFGSNYDTVLAAYTGSCAGLSPVVCNDDNGGLQSKITFGVNAGTTYFFVVTSYDAAAANLTLHINFSGG